MKEFLLMSNPSLPRAAYDCEGAGASVPGQCSPLQAPELRQAFPAPAVPSCSRPSPYRACPAPARGPSSAAPRGAAPSSRAKPRSGLPDTPALAGWPSALLPCLFPSFLPDLLASFPSSFPPFPPWRRARPGPAAAALSMRWGCACATPAPEMGRVGRAGERGDTGGTPGGHCGTRAVTEPRWPGEPANAARRGWHALSPHRGSGSRRVPGLASVSSPIVPARIELPAAAAPQGDSGARAWGGPSGRAEYNETLWGNYRSWE